MALLSSPRTLRVLKALSLMHRPAPLMHRPAPLIHRPAKINLPYVTEQL
ncbi:hypothetical protein [Nostoc sp. KVJ20]|nr:hypothetical protein [Nostoc sp. KVJ20]